MHAVQRTCPATVCSAAIAAFCAALASSPAAQEWPSLYADTPTGLVIEPDSVTKVPGLPGVIGAWFRCAVHPPPRACYAKSQRVYFRINCANGSLAQIQRIAMGLHGEVSSQSDPDFDALYYLPPLGSLERAEARFVCSGLTVPLGTSEAAANLPPP